MPTLSATDQVRSLKHLGYPLVSTMASFNTGLPPLALPTLYRTHELVPRLDTQAVVDECIRVLDILDCIDEKIVKGQRYLPVIKTEGGTEINQRNLDALYEERFRWAQELANFIGADVYPYAEKYSRFLAAGAGINVRVR